MKLNNLFENFSDFARIAKQNRNRGFHLVDDDIELFKKLKQRGFIRGPEADISNWMQHARDRGLYFEFIDFLQRAEKKMQQRDRQRAQTGSPSVFHYRDDDFIIVEPKNHRDACKYGRNTMWCVNDPREDGLHHFTHYTSGSRRLFYLIFDMEKVAISFDPQDTRNPVLFWNENDDTVLRDYVLDLFISEDVDIESVINSIRDNDLKTILRRYFG